MTVVDNARECIAQFVKRAAEIWDVPEDAVVFEDGHCRPASGNVGDFEPLSIADITKQTTMSHGAVTASTSMNVTGAGPGFGLHIVDVKVDEETGRTDVTRYTVVEDAGKAIHPQQVEGQYQGGAVQGIGWALNEEYVYGDDGRLQNAGFLEAAGADRKQGSLEPYIHFKRRGVVIIPAASAVLRQGVRAGRLP